jgi:hypothetical protein
VAVADIDNIVQARGAERLERREEPIVEARLGRSGFREVAGQGDRPVTPHHEGNGRAREQRGQPIRREHGEVLQKLVMSRDRLEQRGGQPP